MWHPFHGLKQEQYQEQYIYIHLLFKTVVLFYKILLYTYGCPTMQIQMMQYNCVCTGIKLSKKLYCIIFTCIVGQLSVFYKDYHIYCIVHNFHRTKKTFFHVFIHTPDRYYKL